MRRPTSTSAWSPRAAAARRPRRGTKKQHRGRRERLGGAAARRFGTVDGRSAVGAWGQPRRMTVTGVVRSSLAGSGPSMVGSWSISRETTAPEAPSEGGAARHFSPAKATCCTPSKRGVAHTPSSTATTHHRPGKRSGSINELPGGRTTDCPSTAPDPARGNRTTPVTVFHGAGTSANDRLPGERRRSPRHSSFLDACCWSYGRTAYGATPHPRPRSRPARATHAARAPRPRRPRPARARTACSRTGALDVVPRRPDVRQRRPVADHRARADLHARVRDDHRPLTEPGAAADADLAADRVDPALRAEHARPGRAPRARPARRARGPRARRGRHAPPAADRANAPASGRASPCQTRFATV